MIGMWLSNLLRAGRFAGAFLFFVFFGAATADYFQFFA